MNQKPTTDETFESQLVTPGTEKDNTEMAEDARSIRRTAKARFTRKGNELLKSMNVDQGREMVTGGSQISKTALLTAQRQDPTIGKFLTFRESGRWPST